MRLGTAAPLDRKAKQAMPGPPMPMQSGHQPYLLLSFMLGCRSFSCRADVRHGRPAGDVYPNLNQALHGRIDDRADGILELG